MIPLKLRWQEIFEKFQFFTSLVLVYRARVKGKKRIFAQF